MSAYASLVAATKKHKITTNVLHESSHFDYDYTVRAFSCFHCCFCLLHNNNDICCSLQLYELRMMTVAWWWQLQQTAHGVRTRYEKNGIVHYLHLLLNGKFVFDVYGTSEISMNVIICSDYPQSPTIQLWHLTIPNIQINQLTKKYKFLKRGGPVDGIKFNSLYSKEINNFFFYRINQSRFYVRLLPSCRCSCCNCCNRKKRKSEPPFYHKINDFIC